MSPMTKSAMREDAVRPFMALLTLSLPLGLSAMLGIAGIAAAQDELTNPFLGQREAIEEGKNLYRQRCVGCHYRRGGRGPNLYASKLTDEQFLETVINGRHGQRGVMPAFGTILSPDDVWKIHAFIKSGEEF
jgi:mono/diheme cytochrome c family protein